MNKYQVTYHYAATGATPVNRVIGVFDAENETAALDSAVDLLCDARTKDSIRAWTRGCMSAKQVLPKKNSATAIEATDTQLGNRLIDIFQKRKGFDYFWAEWDNESRASLKRELGREMRKIAKELQHGQKTS